MEKLKAILIGIGHDPKVVAAARMLALYALPLLIEAAAAWLTGLTDPRLLGIPALTVILMRAVGEALIDQLNKPTQNATFPAPPAGAGPTT